MVEKVSTSPRNVIDFSSYQRALRGSAASLRCCRHCGAALGEGDSEDDCSSISAAADYPARARLRKFFAD